MATHTHAHQRASSFRCSEAKPATVLCVPMTPVVLLSLLSTESSRETFDTKCTPQHHHSSFLIQLYPTLRSPPRMRYPRYIGRFSFLRYREQQSVPEGAHRARQDARHEHSHACYAGDSRKSCSYLLMNTNEDTDEGRVVGHGHHQ